MSGPMGPVCSGAALHLPWSSDALLELELDLLLRQAVVQ